MLSQVVRIEGRAIIEPPNGNITIPGQYHFGPRFRHTEMCYPRRGQPSATHKSMRRSPGPAGFDGQTSYAEQYPDKAARHSCILKREFMGLFALDRDRRVPPVCLGS